MPSNKVLEYKKEVVANFTEQLKKSKIGIFVDYRGVTVDEDNNLRKKLFEAKIEYSIVKNTLIWRAIESAKIENFSEELLNGPTALATSDSDILSICKILVDFSKGNEFFNIKTGFIDGKQISVEEINTYASIPSKEILISKILGSLNAPLSKLVRTLDAIAKDKESENV